jgi:hypothetical protein
MANNRYPGINPHLNSALLLPGGGWQTFHTDQITHLREIIDTLLPGNYYAASEMSLQVATYDSEIPSGKATVIPDVSIYRTTPAPRSSGGAASSSGATFLIPVREMLDDGEELSGVIIYELVDGTLPGKPVTRIELLSPANKFPGSHYYTYLEKRRETLFSGLRLVEIDYIHERRPISRLIPAYSERHSGAYPYHIIVTNPQPDIHDAMSEVHGFGIRSRIPEVDIPLAGHDTVRVDFGAAYNRTYDSSRLFQILVDYAKEPVNFDLYMPEDIERIRAYMAQIHEENRGK